MNGTLIGAAVGAGYGAFVLSGGDLDPVAQWMLVPSAAGIGAGVGLLIDALRP